MIRCVARVSRTSFRRTRPYRLRSSTPSLSLSRVLSTGPLPATDDAWTHPSSQTWEPARKTATKGKHNNTPIADGNKLRDADEVFNIAKKSLEQKKLDPRLVDLMIDKRETIAWSRGAEAIIRIVGKVFKNGGRKTFTLQLLELAQQRTGETYLPSTLGGLLTILGAMGPQLDHKEKKVQVDSDQRALKVAAMLQHFEAQGEVLPVEAYRAAVLALRGKGDCTYALQLAREARNRLDASSDLRDVYDFVVQQAHENGLSDVALEILEEMTNAGGKLAPGNATYRAVFGVLIKTNRIREVMEIYESMLRRGVTGDKRALSSVLGACARDASYWEDALDIIESMRFREGEEAANIHHYTSAVTSCLKAQRWKEAVELLDRMEERGVTPTDRLLDHVMQATAQAKQWTLAEGIFRAMTEKYGHGSLVTYQSMGHFVEAMVMQKKLRKAINCVGRVHKFRMRGRRPDMTLDTRLLKCLKRIPGITAQALASVLMALIDKGIEMHPDSYAIVIGHASKEGEKELGRSLYQNMLASDKPLSLSAVNAAMKCSSDMDEAKALMQFLKKQGLEPSHETYSAMLQACCGAVVDEENDDGCDDSSKNLMCQSDVIRRAEEAMRVWEDMGTKGLICKGSMVPYIIALMEGGQWELALRERDRHRHAHNEQAGGPDLVKKGHKLGRVDSVINSTLCHGLVTNGQSALAIEELDKVLKSKSPLKDVDLDYVDEDNYVVLAGIRACATSDAKDSWKKAVEFLEWLEDRWAARPRSQGAGDGKGERLAMSELARASRRRVYDAMICLLDSKHAPPNETRKILERGMRNGAVSMVEDSGSRHDELSIDLHKWGIPSSRLLLRSILEGILQDEDFLQKTGQYRLAALVQTRASREFSGGGGRWHADSPDPRGRRREFVGGVKPSRFAERAYGEAKDGKEQQDNPEFWWRNGRRLSLIVGRPRPSPSIRHELEDFCTFRLRPPLRIKIDPKNKGVLTLEHADLMAWLAQNPTFLDDNE